MRKRSDQLIREVMKRASREPDARFEVLTLAVSPFGLRVGLSGSRAQEMNEARSFLISGRPGFILEDGIAQRVSASLRETQSALFGETPEHARMSLSAYSVTQDLDGQRHLIGGRHELYGSPSLDPAAQIEKISRAVPEADEGDEISVWAIIGVGTPTIFVPARSERIAALRAIARLSVSGNHVSPEMSTTYASRIPVDSLRDHALRTEITPANLAEGPNP